MFYNIKKIKLFFIILFILLLPTASYGAMVSDSYVIYENVMHAFDGPVISNVSSSVSDNTATVTWNTDISSDSFVEYDTDNTFPNSMEQGTLTLTTSHSVQVVGLDYDTTYYFRVRSRGANTDTGVSSVYSFSVGSNPNPGSTSSAGGGGVLIIDKTDKQAPLISDISVQSIGAKTAVITWKTDEESSSFVEYGKTVDYGSTVGQWDKVIDHSVVLHDLSPNTLYNFRVLSSDDWGNLASSSRSDFQTISGTEGEQIDEEIEKIVEENPRTLLEASQKALDLMKEFSGLVSVDTLENTLFSHIGSLEDLAKIIPAPVLGGEPKVEVDADKATISWRTNKQANSLVAIASEDLYNPNSDEPYAQIVGNPDELTLEHQVTIFNLKQNTTYHYQLRSKGKIGPEAKSGDFVFQTGLENLQIISFFSQVVNDNEAIFKWATNKQSDSVVKYIPYNGNDLAMDRAKVVRSDKLTVIHEIKISDFTPGVFYNIELSSSDKDGNMAQETIESFSTAEDDLPPVISQIKTNSTLFTNKENRIQTVISWLTNEPATTQVYYMEGVHNAQQEFKNKTPLNSDYSKEHIVVFTKFKPGVVYSFRVESIDSGGNATLSQVHTFMTPKKKESIIQVIIRIFENTFGWVNKLFK